MRKFKTRFKLVKNWVFLIYSSLAVDGGEIRESCGCEQRFLSSLTEKKEQGTSVSQGSRSVTILFVFFSLFLPIFGDQLVPFAHRKITVWLTFEERKDRLLFVHKFMSTRKLALVIQNTLN